MIYLYGVVILGVIVGLVDMFLRNRNSEELEIEKGEEDDSDDLYLDYGEPL